MSTEGFAPGDEPPRRGLASASEETRLRVAHKGGVAPHKKRGLAAASSETRARVAKSGGNARALDREALSSAGRRGGMVVKGKYGAQFYREIGEKGGSAVKQRYGTGFYSEIGRRGGKSVRQTRGAEYYSIIGRKGGKARSGAKVDESTATIQGSENAHESAPTASSADSVA